MFVACVFFVDLCKMIMRFKIIELCELCELCVCISCDCKFFIREGILFPSVLTIVHTCDDQMACICKHLTIINVKNGEKMCASSAIHFFFCLLLYSFDFSLPVPLPLSLARHHRFVVFCCLARASAHDTSADTRSQQESEKRKRNIWPGSTKRHERRHWKWSVCACICIAIEIANAFAIVCLCEYARMNRWNEHMCERMAWMMQ